LGLPDYFLDFGKPVLFRVIVECAFLLVVEDDTVVKESEFSVWDAQVVVGFGGELFPVADGIVGKVTNCASCEPERYVANGLFFDEFADYVKRIANRFMGLFARAFVTNYRFAVFYRGYGRWLEAYERVSCQFAWSLDGL
jgi:hypothetical protein